MRRASQENKIVSLGAVLLVGLDPSFGSCFTVVQYFYLFPPHPPKETVIMEGIVNCKLMRSCSVTRLCMEIELSSCMCWMSFGGLFTCLNVYLILVVGF